MFFTGVNVINRKTALPLVFWFTERLTITLFARCLFFNVETRFEKVQLNTLCTIDVRQPNGFCTVVRTQKALAFGLQAR